MALPKKPKKETKPVSITVRLSIASASHLKTLATEHGLNQTEVIEFLIENEFKKWMQRRKRQAL